MISPRLRARAVNRGFIVWVVMSVLLHCGLVAGAVYAQSLQPRVKTYTSIPVELISFGRERNPLLLPRKAAPPPPAEPPPADVPPPVEPPPEPPAPVEPPPPPADAVALETGAEPEKQKAPAKKRRPTKRRLSSAAKNILGGSPRNARADDALKRLELNEGSPDGSAQGTTTDPSRAAEGYYQELKAALLARYTVPSTIPSAQRRFLKAKIILYILPSGRVKNHKIVEAHSNKFFMSALVKLLTDKDLQLPAPPRVLRRQVENDGVELVFAISS